MCLFGRIRNFVSAFGVDGLIPYLESLARQLEKHVAQTKKSMVSRAGQFLKGFTYVSTFFIF